MGSPNERTKEFKKRLYGLVLRLVRFLDSLPRDRVSYRISDQLFRSGSSVLATHVEGHGASSKKDFANFINHALKSANESKMWLALLRDSGRANGNEVEWLLAEFTEVANVLGSSIVTLRRGNTKE